MLHESAPDPGGTDPWVGQVLDGRYRIEARIAEGGFGAVYRATQMAIERPVAVKLLHGAIATDDRHCARFRREAMALAQLKHPGIVQVIDFGALPGARSYLVMELLDGETLQAHLLRHGPLAPDRVIDIGVALLDALAEAHERGVVHRDIKPENVIVVRRGERSEVKLVDFGIATLERDASITQSGVLIGSPRYLSPEQAADLPVSEKTDVYSLGLVLYELLLGRPAFTRRSAREYLVAHLDDPPDAPVRDGVAVRGRILQTLMRFMTKSASERPSARAAAALLDTCRGEQLVLAGAPDPKRGRATPIMIGRGMEQDAFERLADGELRVLTFVGAGGVGKTTLLGVCCERARDRGMRVKWLDGVELANLAQLLSVTFQPIIDDPPDLLVVDRAERIGAVLDGLRDGILPELPMRTRLLMATRRAPGWDIHPGSIGTVLELTLGNLSVPESCALLDARGVPEALQLAAWDESRGHPLTLALMSDVLESPGSSLATLLRTSHSAVGQSRTDETPAFLDRLARELVEHVPSEAHRAGLLAACLVRRLSDDDLQQVVDARAVASVRSWLAELACARTRTGGIEVHDLTRRAILLDARLNTPERLPALFEPLAKRALERLRRAPESMLQQRLVDLGYLVGQVGDVPYDPIDVNDLPPMVPAEDHHWPAIEALLERFEGPRAVACLRAWRGPHCHAVVVEGGGALLGFAAGLRLDSAPPELIARDPGTAAMARALFDDRMVSRARPSYYFRFWAGQHHHLPSHTQTHIFYYLMRLATTVRDLGAVVSAHHPPEFWRRLHPHSAHEMFEDAAFELDGRAFMPFGRDFTELPRREWLCEHFEKMFGARDGIAPPLMPMEAAAQWQM